MNCDNSTIRWHHAIILSTIAMLGLWAGRLQGAETTDAEKITFQDHVFGVFRKHCLVCHTQSEKKGGLALDSYLATMDGGSSGAVVDSDGSPSDSRLWQLMAHEDTPIMPPGRDRISDAELELVRIWIETGAPENSGSPAKPRPKNALAQVSASAKRPDGGGAMPVSAPYGTIVATDRPAATSALAASPWAPLVAIAGQRQILMYHADTADLLAVLPFPEGVAQSLRFSRDGAFLIAGGGEHSVSGLGAAYDVATGKRIAQVGDELDTVFDADADPAMQRMALGGPQGVLRIFDATDGQMLHQIDKHTDWILAVAYCSEGRFVASGDRSGGLHVWESETGQLGFDLAGHKGAINALAWRDDGQVLASASSDGTVRLWDIRNGKMIRSINAGGKVFDVQFDHQGRMVTAGEDKKAKLWDANGKLIKQFASSGGEPVLEAVMSHDGKRVVHGDWTGCVVSVPIDDPKQEMELPAMLASNEYRKIQLEKRLVDRKTEQEKLQTSIAQHQAARAKASQAFTAWREQFNQAQAAADQANKQAAGLLKEQTVSSNRIADATARSRELHDAVVAARVALKTREADEKQNRLQLDLATAEQQLAEHLTRLATDRRKLVALPRQLGEVRKRAKSMRQKTKQLARQEHGLQKGLQVAEKKLQQSTAKLSEVTSSGELLKAKMAVLAQWVAKGNTGEPD